MIQVDPWNGIFLVMFLNPLVLLILLILQIFFVKQLKGLEIQIEKFEQKIIADDVNKIDR